MSSRFFVAIATAIALHVLPGAITAQTASAPANPARAALAELDRQADALFVAAEKRNWDGAKRALHATKAGVDRLRAQAFEGPYADAGGRMEALYLARHRLDAEVAEADIALGAQDGPGVMRHANRITMTVADLGAPIEPPLVHQAMILAYIARELEYAHAARRGDLYTQTAVEIRQLWSRLRPAFAARKPPPDLAGIDAAIARLGTGSRGDPEAAKLLGAAIRAARATP
jgi:hypothetical protein